MTPYPTRLKRILTAFLSLQIIASPALLAMPDGPPKIITAGVWFLVFILTMIFFFVIQIAPPKR